MKIAVIGSGAVGLLYGARLARTGHDVRFLMRRDLQAVRRRGLTVESCDGDFHLIGTPPLVDPQTAADTPEILQAAMQKYADNIGDHLLKYPDHISKM